LYQQNVDWVLTLTPNCYPVCNAASIEKFFEQTEFDAYLDMHNVADKTWAHVDDFLMEGMQKQPWFKIPVPTRKGKINWRYLRKRIPAEKNPFINGSNIYYQGSNYFALNRKALGTMVDPDSAVNHLIAFYYKFIRQMPDMHPCPQETIIQTFIGNQKDLRVCYNNNYRFIDWKNAVNWSPNWLTDRHFEAIVESKSHFARKFRYPESATLIERIEKELW
jgi:Core-2/I-Branching enzyme